SGLPIVDGSVAVNDIYMFEDDDITMGSLTSTSGLVDLIAGEDITAGWIWAARYVNLTSQRGSIYGVAGRGGIYAYGNSTLNAAGVIGTINTPVDVDIRNGSLSTFADSMRDCVSVNIRGVVYPSDQLNLGNETPGLVLFNSRRMGGGNLYWIAEPGLSQLDLADMDMVKPYYTKQLKGLDELSNVARAVEASKITFYDQEIYGTPLLVDTRDLGYDIVADKGSIYLMEDGLKIGEDEFAYPYRFYSP
ncbi:MAG: hypothetical protein ABIH01_01115, partial [Candidatus Omnitrophota bacterium]